MSDKPTRPVVWLDELERRVRASTTRPSRELIPGNAVVYANFVAAVEPDPDNERRMTFVVTTAKTNRNGHRVNPDGWELANYQRNPVMLWCHDDGSWKGSGSHGLPFASGERVWIDGDYLKVASLWVPAGTITGEAGELCESVLRLYRGGFLRAVSAGWLPLEWDYVETEDGGWEVAFIRQELLEISFVPIPAEPEALRVAASAGLDVGPVRAWARALVGEPRYVMNLDAPIPRKEVSALREQFAEFYPGAKLLMLPDTVHLASVDDITPVTTITPAELAGERARLAGEVAAEPQQTTAAPGTPAPAATDAPAERSFRGSLEWRTRQLALLNL